MLQTKLEVRKRLIKSMWKKNLKYIKRALSEATFRGVLEKDLPLNFLKFYKKTRVSESLMPFDGFSEQK